MKKAMYILLMGIFLLNTASFCQNILPADTPLFPRDSQSADTPVIIERPNYVFRENESGLHSLMKYQEEQRAKQKKAAMIRIGIGIAFLVVLVVGLSRRSRRNKE